MSPGILTAMVKVPSLLVMDPFLVPFTEMLHQGNSSFVSASFTEPWIMVWEKEQREERNKMEDITMVSNPIKYFKVFIIGCCISIVFSFHRFHSPCIEKMLRPCKLIFFRERGNTLLKLGFNQFPPITYSITFYEIISFTFIYLNFFGKRERQDRSNFQLSGFKINILDFNHPIF